MDNSDIKIFFESWADCNVKGFYLALLKYLESKSEDVVITFIARPGVTYSLRAGRSGQVQREIFAVVDAVDEEQRWLSVCFYCDLITDPEERGELIPGGILGEDGCCFDVEEADLSSSEVDKATGDTVGKAYLDYLKKRIDEAFENAY